MFNVGLELAPRRVLREVHIRGTAQAPALRDCPASHHPDRGFESRNDQACYLKTRRRSHESEPVSLNKKGSALRNVFERRSTSV